MHKYTAYQKYKHRIVLLDFGLCDKMFDAGMPVPCIDRVRSYLMARMENNKENNNA